MKLIMDVFLVQRQTINVHFLVVAHKTTAWDARLVFASCMQPLSDEFWKLTYTPTFTVSWPLVADGPEEALQRTFSYFYISLYTLFLG